MSEIAFRTPDPAILARRGEIVAGLARLLPADCLVSSERELVPFETDGFTAYRRVPLAVVLPETTEQVSAVMKFLSVQKVPVVARGAGTSLSGGAIPQEDAVVVGVSRMSRILEVDLPNRVARVQAGVTNISISNAVDGDGFFFAPDPSSQLACTIAGNIGMNSGGAHCLKYGVTTNNLLGLAQEIEIDRREGRHLVTVRINDGATAKTSIDLKEPLFIGISYNDAEDRFNFIVSEDGFVYF